MICRLFYRPRPRYPTGHGKLSSSAVPQSRPRHRGHPRYSPRRDRRCHALCGHSKKRAPSLLGALCLSLWRSGCACPRGRLATEPLSITKLRLSCGPGEQDDRRHDQPVCSARRGVDHRLWLGWTGFRQDHRALGRTRAGIGGSPLLAAGRVLPRGGSPEGGGAGLCHARRDERGRGGVVCPGARGTMPAHDGRRGRFCAPGPGRLRPAPSPG